MIDEQEQQRQQERWRELAEEVHHGRAMRLHLAPRVDHHQAFHLPRIERRHVHADQRAERMTHDGEFSNAKHVRQLEQIGGM